jgi:hypothetical protein
MRPYAARNDAALKWCTAKLFFGDQTGLSGHNATSKSGHNEISQQWLAAKHRALPRAVKSTIKQRSWNGS